MRKISLKQLSTLVIILAIALAFSGCGRKRENAGNQNYYPDNYDKGDLKEKIISNIQIVDINNIDLIFDPWSNDSKSFLFKKYDTDICGHNICDYELYKYNIETNKIEIESQDKNIENGWVVSNSTKLAIKIISGSMEMPSEDLGTIYIKNLATNEIKRLGKQTYKSGDQNKFTFNSYQNPVWSPDDKWIAFYNDEHWDQNGREVVIISASANNINEMKALGKTSFIGVARNDEHYIYWSPDSTKLFVKDSYPIFSISSVSEIYRPKTEKRWIGENPWRWSPNSKKILITDITEIDSDYGNLNFYILDIMSNDDNKEIILDERVSFDDYFLKLSADWSPDSKKIVYAYNQNLYVLDMEKMSKVLITEKAKDYINPNWSPDGKKIIYQINNQIWMITLE